MNFVFLFYIFTIPAFDRTRNVNVFARAEMRFVHTHSRPFDQHNDDAFVHACAKALRSLRFFFFTLCSVCDFFSFYVAVVAATGSKSSLLLFNGPETNILLTIVFSLYDIHKTICVKDLFIRLVGLVSSLSLLCEPNADGLRWCSCHGQCEQRCVLYFNSIRKISEMVDIRCLPSRVNVNAESHIEHRNMLLLAIGTSR